MLDVLVVDDSDLVRTMIVRTMKMAEIPLGEVHEASDGHEALAALRTKPVDLMLMDINMPVMDGMELLKCMRSTEELRRVPIIVVSAEGTRSRLSQLEGLGITAFVRKPFTPETIRDVVLAATAGWDDEGGRESIRETLELVLERFTFSFGEPVLVSELVRPVGELLCARLEFAGPRAGHLIVAAPTDAARDMAANILGLEPVDVDTIVAADALGEVVNIACGHLVSGLETGDQTELYPPEVYRAHPGEWDRLLDHPSAVGFVVDGHPVLVAFCVR